MLLTFILILTSIQFVQDRLHEFPVLFTDSSEDIRFFYILHFLFSVFSCWFRAINYDTIRC